MGFLDYSALNNYNRGNHIFEINSNKTSIVYDCRFFMLRNSNICNDIHSLINGDQLASVSLYYSSIRIPF